MKTTSLLSMIGWILIIISWLLPNKWFVYAKKNKLITQIIINVIASIVFFTAMYVDLIN